MAGSHGTEVSCARQWPRLTVTRAPVAHDPPLRTPYGRRVTRTLFSGGEVFDGTGADPRPADVVIEGDRIVAVGAPGTGDGDDSIDLSGRTLLPGLFDCHVHVSFSGIDILQDLQTPFSYRFFLAAQNLATTLRAGITSVRDAAGADAGVKLAVERGLVAGPRMQISIDMISQTGGHGDEYFPCGLAVPILGLAYPGKPRCIVDGADEMRRKVRELIRDGADVLKVASSGGVLSVGSDPRRAHFRPAELEVLVEEATAASRFVMAHAQASDGIKNAVRAGVRSIEHGRDKKRSGNSTLRYPTEQARELCSSG